MPRSKIKTATTAATTSPYPDWWHVQNARQITALQELGITDFESMLLCCETRSVFEDGTIQVALKELHSMCNRRLHRLHIEIVHAKRDPRVRMEGVHPDVQIVMKTDNAATYAQVMHETYGFDARALAAGGRTPRSARPRCSQIRRVAPATCDAHPSHGCETAAQR